MSAFESDRFCVCNKSDFGSVEYVSRLPCLPVYYTSIVFWLVLKVAYSNEVATKIQVFPQIESCFKTEFVFSILVQKTGEVIHSFSLIG